MAHPKREVWAKALAKELDCPIAWDSDDTVWHTCRSAWQLADKTADYHVVIQDDAIVCKNFKEKAETFITKMINQHGENYAFDFYYGNHNCDVQRVIEKGLIDGFVERRGTSGGVAICLPTKWIKQMIESGNQDLMWQDDNKINNFLLKNHFRVLIPLPALVTHRRMKDNPSIITETKGGRDSNRYSPWFIDGDSSGKKTIPKIIHQIWIGDRTLQPNKLMDTWKMAGWEYKLWTEAEIDALELQNRSLYDFYYNKGCYYGASDVVRIEALQRFGGIYIDADTERLADIDDLLDCDFFAVTEDDYSDRIANGVIGSVPQHEILNKYIKEMGEAKTVEPVWSTIGGTMFTKVINEVGGENIKILKPVTFYPVDAQGRKARSREKNYAFHHWGSTYNLYGKL